MSNKKNTYTLMTLITAFTSILAVSLPQTAAASIWLSAGPMALIKSSCSSGPQEHQELDQLKREISAADTVVQARTLALAPTDDALGALKNARSLMPFSDDLRSAETRLSDARARILVASSQEQIADEFDGMMLAGLDNDRAAHVNVGSGSCDYSSGEMIAIVIGLILGIIPGLILLVLLC
ncbi:MAG: hypothetical protein Q7U57_10510 [Methylovulum sp.]|nr:hypothetical protein [Methylovulum sp.]